MPRCSAVERLGDLTAVRVLGQVAAGPRLQRGDDRFVVGVGREQDDCDLRMLASQPLGRADAVEHWHVEVQQDRVGLVPGDCGDRLFAVGDGGDHLDVGDHVEHHLQSLAYDGLVVGDHDPQTLLVRRIDRAHRFTRACTTHRSPTGPACSSPSINRNRSCMPARP